MPRVRANAATKGLDNGNAAPPASTPAAAEVLAPAYAHDERPARGLLRWWPWRRRQPYVPIYLQEEVAAAAPPPPPPSPRLLQIKAVWEKCYWNIILLGWLICSLLLLEYLYSWPCWGWWRYVC